VAGIISSRSGDWPAAVRVRFQIAPFVIRNRKTTLIGGFYPERVKTPQADGQSSWAAQG
jgi:hypothetical protein